MKLKNGVMFEFAAFWEGRLKNRRGGAECLKGTLRCRCRSLSQFNAKSLQKITKDKNNQPNTTPSKKLQMKETRKTTNIQKIQSKPPIFDGGMIGQR